MSLNPLKASGPAGAGWLAALLLLIMLALPGPALAAHDHQWSQEDKATLKSLHLDRLGEPPPSPSNAYADDPAAAAFGRKIFFDKRFSADGTVSCATCHQPEMSFTDDLPVAHGMGFTARRSMTLIGAPWYDWFFWDGRKDSLWSQAIGPLESPVEHGISRTRCALLIQDNYREEYGAVFGRLPEIDREKSPPEARPDPGMPEVNAAWMAIPLSTRMDINEIFANIGKSVAAYERTLRLEPSRFDRYVEAVLEDDIARAASTMTGGEAMGLQLFIGKAGCINCHNGPLFTNSHFHNVGLKEPPAEDEPVDLGRATGIPQVLADNFNCLGPYSDARPSECREIRFMDTDARKYRKAFKTPTLRNVADHPPYMHDGRLKTLSAVLKHYSSVDPEALGAGELSHPNLTKEEQDFIEAFLRTLTSAIVERPPKSK